MKDLEVQLMGIWTTFAAAHVWILNCIVKTDDNSFVEYFLFSLLACTVHVADGSTWAYTLYAIRTIDNQQTKTNIQHWLQKHVWTYSVLVLLIKTSIFIISELLNSYQNPNCTGVR